MNNCFPGPTDDEINAMFPPPEPDRSTLGGLIKATRRAQGMTQKELARKCGFSFKFVSDLENNRLTTNPETETLCLLSVALDIPAVELMEVL